MSNLLPIEKYIFILNLICLSLLFYSCAEFARDQI